MAKRNADFLSWDDDEINLDLLLGDFTDYEAENCNPSESVKGSCLYICPR